MTYNPILRLGKADVQKLRAAVGHMNNARILIAEVWDQQLMPATESDLAKVIEDLDEARTNAGHVIHEHGV